MFIYNSLYDAGPRGGHLKQWDIKRLSRAGSENFRTSNMEPPLQPGGGGRKSTVPFEVARLMQHPKFQWLSKIPGKQTENAISTRSLPGSKNIHVSKLETPMKSTTFHQIYRWISSLHRMPLRSFRDSNIAGSNPSIPPALTLETLTKNTKLASIHKGSAISSVKASKYFDASHQ